MRQKFTQRNRRRQSENMLAIRRGGQFINHAANIKEPPKVEETLIAVECGDLFVKIASGANGLKIKGMINIISKYWSEPTRTYALHDIQNARPFIFDEITWMPNIEEKKLDLPFCSMSIEATGTNTILSFKNKDNHELHVFCMSATKRPDGFIKYFALIQFNDRVTLMGFTSANLETPSTKMGFSVERLVWGFSDLVKTINESEQDERLTKERIAITTRKNGINRTVQKHINKIVFIKPKEHIAHPDSSESSREYSHRWEVRGHWRQIKSVGFGPDGEVISGKTWVHEHVKGPEEKEIVKKIRVKTHLLNKDNYDNTGSINVNP